MDKLRVVAIGLLLMIVVGCSGGAKDDFRGTEWGMTKNEVIAVEEKKGNTLFEEDFEDEEELTLEYTDLTVNGFQADVEYTFSNTVDVPIMDAVDDPKLRAWSEEFDDPNTSEERMEELQVEVEQYLEEHPDLFEESQLEASFREFRLLEGRYYFTDMDEDDSTELLKSLTDKYGEPTEDESYDGESTIYLWETNRTMIYYDGDDFIVYNALYPAIKRHVVKNAQAGQAGQDDEL